MIKKKVKVCALLLLSLNTIVNAQDATISTGGDASGTGGTVSYSTGQISFTQNTGSNGSVLQGVQQPLEISVITGIKEARDINLSIIAYPNPTIDVLNLDIENYDLDNLSYQLMDLNGRLISKKELLEKRTSIKIDELPTATYLLMIRDQEKEIKTFKVIKN